MKKIMYAAMATAIIGLFAFTLMTAAWKVKTGEASVKFTSGKINGSFSGLKASVLFDPQHPDQAKILASVDAASIATGFFLKSDHAKDALGVDKYATIKFSSTGVSKSGSGYVARGNLTMKGVTKPATINFTFDNKGSQGVFNGTMKVVPREFGIDHNGTPDKVMVSLTVPVTKE